MMDKTLNLMVLEMIEELLPKTTVRNNQKLKTVLKKVRQELEK